MTRLARLGTAGLGMAWRGTARRGEAGAAKVTTRATGDGRRHSGKIAMAKKKAAKKSETTPDEPGDERDVPKVPSLPGDAIPFNPDVPVESQVLTMGVDIVSEGTSVTPANDINGEIIPVGPQPIDPECEPEPFLLDITIKVPLFGDFNKPPGHVDAQLNRKQATTLRQIQHALDMGDYRMANGRHVHTKADVVKWLIDQIGGDDGE